jgi:hypothetical protein
MKVILKTPADSMMMKTIIMTRRARAIVTGRAAVAMRKNTRMTMRTRDMMRMKKMKTTVIMVEDQDQAVPPAVVAVMVAADIPAEGIMVPVDILVAGVLAQADIQEAGTMVADTDQPVRIVEAMVLMKETMVVEIWTETVDPVNMVAVITREVITVQGLGYHGEVLAETVDRAITEDGQATVAIMDLAAVCRAVWEDMDFLKAIMAVEEMPAVVMAA